MTAVLHRFGRRTLGGGRARCRRGGAEGRRRRRNRLVLLQRRQERLAQARQLSGHAVGIGAQDLGSDHDDQLGAVLLRGLAAEQQPEHWNVADSRNLL